MPDKDQDASFLDKYKVPETAFLEKYRTPATGPKEANPASEAEMFQQTISSKPDATETLHGAARGKFLSTGNPAREVPRVLADPQMGAAGIVTKPTPTKQEEAEAINRNEAIAGGTGFSLAPLIIGGTEAAGAGGVAGLGRYAIQSGVKPLIRGAIGSEAGKYLGGKVGGWFGHPEWGATAGEIGGGLYGAAGGKIPRLGLHSIADMLESSPEAEAEAGNVLRGARTAEVPAALPTIKPRPLIPRPAAAAPAIPTVEAVPVNPPTRYDLGEIGAVPRSAPETLSSPNLMDRATMAQSELRPVRPGASEATGKFHELFGPEYQEAADLAEWETGSPEGVQSSPGLKPLRPLEGNTMEPQQLKPIAERSLGEQQVKPKLEDVINRAVGVRPLEPNVPLKDQLTSLKPIEAGEEVDPLKVKYPDAKVRQLVRANGERLFEAAKGDPDLLKQLHDLTRVDLREALINAGEDMDQKTISDSKFAGEGSISRKQAFEKLLDKGHSPEKILDLAKPKETAE